MSLTCFMDGVGAIVVAQSRLESLHVAHEANGVACLVDKRAFLSLSGTVKLFTAFDRGLVHCHYALR